MVQGTCPALEDLIAPEMRLTDYGGTQPTPRIWWPPVVPVSSHNESDTFESIENFDTSLNKLLHLPFIKNPSAMKKLNSQLSDAQIEDSLSNIIDS